MTRRVYFSPIRPGYSVGSAWGRPDATAGSGRSAECFQAGDRCERSVAGGFVVVGGCVPLVRRCAFSLMNRMLRSAAYVFTDVAGDHVKCQEAASVAVKPRVSWEYWFR